MKNNDSVIEFQDLLDKSEDSILNFLEKKTIFSSDLSEDWNWVALSELVSLKVTTNINSFNNALSLRWAQVGILIYDYLADKDNELKEILEFSSMRLRVQIISSIGHTESNQVLDAEYIFKWFRNSLKLSIYEVVAKSQEASLTFGLLNESVPGMEADMKNKLSEILELRRIKTRINLIKVLSESNKVKIPADIIEWLSLREKLP